MKKTALIVAGGSGTRMKSTTPKQFLLLNNLPILAHTLKSFYNFDKDIDLVLVLPKSQISTWVDLCSEHSIEIPHKVVAGGERRFDSVANGLAEIHGDGLVAIHDGVRPMVEQGTIQRVFEKAESAGNAIPVMPIKESVRQIDGSSSKAVDRSQFVRVQTPQCFSLETLRKAYQQPFSEHFTDDASVVESLGESIHLVEGDERNIKITTPEDLRVAHTLINS